MDGRLADSQSATSKLEAQHSRTQNEMIRWKRDCIALHKKLISLQTEYDRLRDENETHHEESTLTEERNLRIITDLQKDTDTLSAQSERIETQLKEKNMELAKLDEERCYLARINAELETGLSQLRTEHTRLGDAFEDFQATSLATFQAFKILDLRRTESMHSLLVSSLILWRFSRYLGSRLISEIKAKGAVVRQWRTVSHQKVEARRDSIRAYALGQDLQSQLDIESRLRDSETAAALKWHTEFYKSVKARDRAASKFRSYQEFVSQRYSDTMVKLLAGLLVLWRLCVALTQHLADARALIRALESSIAEAHHLGHGNTEVDPLMDPTPLYHLRPDDFSQLPAAEAQAAYVLLSKDYQRLRLEYRRFAESCAGSEDDAPLSSGTSQTGHKDSLTNSMDLSKSDDKSDNLESPPDYDAAFVSLRNAEEKYRVAGQELRASQERSSKLQAQLKECQHNHRTTLEQLRSIQEVLTQSEDRCRSSQANLFKSQAEAKSIKEAHDRVKSYVATLEAQVSSPEDIRGVGVQKTQFSEGVRLLEKDGSADVNRTDLVDEDQRDSEPPLLPQRTEGEEARKDQESTSPTSQNSVNIVRPGIDQSESELTCWKRTQELESALADLTGDHRALNVAFATTSLRAKKEATTARKNADEWSIYKIRNEVRRNNLIIRVNRLREKMIWLEGMDGGYRQLLFLNQELIPRGTIADLESEEEESESEEERVALNQQRSSLPLSGGVLLGIIPPSTSSTSLATSAPASAPVAPQPPTQSTTLQLPPAIYGPRTRRTRARTASGVLPGQRVNSRQPVATVLTLNTLARAANASSRYVKNVHPIHGS